MSSLGSSRHWVPLRPRPSRHHLGSSCGDGVSPTTGLSVRIPESVLTVDQGTSAMDVAPYFQDPDGDALTYDAVSSIIGVVSVNVMRWARSRPTVNERRVGRSDGAVDGGHRAAGVSSVVGSAR